MNTFTLISVFVGVAGLVVGIVQLVLMLIQIHKDKKYTVSCEPIKVHARKRFDVNLDLTESGAGD